MKYIPFVSYYLVFFYIPLLFSSLIPFLKRDYTGGLINVLTIENLSQFDYEAFGEILLKGIALNVAVLFPLILVGFVCAYILQTMRNRRIADLCILFFLALFASEGLVKIFAYDIFYGNLLENSPYVSYTVQSCFCLLPISILLLYNGMHSVPSSIYEVSDDLGASYFQKALFVTLPMIKVHIILVQFLCFLIAFFNFLYSQMFLRGKMFLVGNYLKFLFFDIGDWPSSVISATLSVFFILLFFSALAKTTNYAIKRLS